MISADQPLSSVQSNYKPIFCGCRILLKSGLFPGGHPEILLVELIDTCLECILSSNVIDYIPGSLNTLCP
jgi:hypothetical protein